ncbi:unnamed protein product, partial [Ectocarpus fasciculatus]
RRPRSLRVDQVHTLLFPALPPSRYPCIPVPPCPLPAWAETTVLLAVSRITKHHRSTAVVCCCTLYRPPTIGPSPKDHQKQIIIHGTYKCAAVQWEGRGNLLAPNPARNAEELHRMRTEEEAVWWSTTLQVGPVTVWRRANVCAVPYAYTMGGPSGRYSTTCFLAALT